MNSSFFSSSDTSACETFSSWFLWRDQARSPAMNMAIDETLLLQASAIGKPVLRFYRWDRPAISIGYTQQYHLTARPGAALVRRPTGGGVVDHDHDFTYSVAVPPDHYINSLNRLESYHVIHRAVRSGLSRLDISAELAEDQISGSIDRASMVCFENPTRYDLVAFGRKIGGSAQRRSRAGLLHQGSLHFGGRLPAGRKRLEDAFVSGFESELEIEFQPFHESKSLVEQAMELRRRRYDTEEWNRGQ